MKVVNNIADLIGNTPLVKLNRITPEDSAAVYLKLEFFNPSGSVKDRAAYNMIIEAEKQGLLKPNSTIIEPTSGNTGIGIAMNRNNQEHSRSLLLLTTAARCLL